MVRTALRLAIASRANQHEPTTGQTTMDADPSTDEILKTLANPQRRVVLRELVEESCSEVSVDALEEVVAHELEAPPMEIRSTSEIAIQLRHVHLPRLDEVGLCEYDPDRECVEYCPNEFVEQLLAFIEERRRTGRVH